MMIVIVLAIVDPQQALESVLFATDALLETAPFLVLAIAIAAGGGAEGEAGYMYGYFFPQERGGLTDDMHCWVVTRHNGEILEWDIAHHIKAGLGKTAPGLNPRPGRRVALGHSMGHHYRTGEGRTVDLKLLAEPLMLSDSGSWDNCQITVHSTEE